MRFNVKVPASSANLGSGFDTLAVALNYFTELDVESVEKGISIEGGPDLGGGDNLIARGIQIAAEAAGRPEPGCRVARNLRDSGRTWTGKFGDGTRCWSGCRQPTDGSTALRSTTLRARDRR